jgi:hypothetical protein
MNKKILVLLEAARGSLFTFSNFQFRPGRKKLLGRFEKSSLIALAVFVCAGAPARAETFQVLEDTYSTKGDITKAAGTAASLLVGPKNSAYIKFGVTNADFTASQVTAARMTIYFPSVTTAGTLEFYANKSDFSEIVTASTPAPSQNPTNLGALEVTLADKHNFAVVDVTAQVQSWVSGAAPDYGFAIVSSNGAALTIGAKDGPGTGYAAVLEVDVSPSAIVGTNATLNGNLTASNVTAGSFSGNGSALIALNASQLATGTVPLAQLPSAVVTNTETGLTLGGNFTGTLTGNATTATTATMAGRASNVVSGIAITNAFLTNAVITNSTFSGNGGGLTNLSVSNLGSITLAQLPGVVVTNQETGVTLSNLTLNGGLTLGDANGNLAVGIQAFDQNTSGYDNTAIGFQALSYNTNGYQNTADGFGALYYNTSGDNNTANGYEALYYNTSGSDNTANGFQALAYNTNGYQNTADGFGALYYNTSGDNNTADGYEALYYNTTASDNTANGFQALYSNTNGAYNTADGFGALFDNTSGSDNAATGYEALYSNTNGFQNTADGDQALYSNTGGYNNTAVGYQALFDNTTGINNTATGLNALASNTNGSANTAAGFESLYNNTSGYNNTANGFGALFANTSGYNNTASGINALYNNTNGYNNTASGFEALYNIPSGTNNVAVGFNAGSAFTNAESYNIDIGNNGVAGESGIIRIGANGVQTNCYLAGTVYANGTFVSSSDRNAKKNIEPVDPREVLEKVAAMPVSRWNYKQADASAHIGPMAQDFYSAFNVGPDEKHITTIDESGVALAAIQGLNQKLEEKDAEIEQLKQSVAELKAMVSQLARAKNQ